MTDDPAKAAAEAFLRQRQQTIARAAGRCGTCNSRVIWTLTAAEKRMPVDPDPATEGNLLLVPSQTGRHVRSIVLRDRGLETAAARGEPLHLSHFATCPQADKHRRKR